MIKRVKHMLPDALIASDDFRTLIERFESDILRGISKLAILSAIRASGEDGTYGYKLLKDLEETTNHMLIIEEGTLYPLLRKLKDENLIWEEKHSVGGRTRKHYFLTPRGQQFTNHATGFFSKLVEAIGPLFEMDIQLSGDNLYCPNCANILSLHDKSARFCEICGLNIEEIRSRRLNSK